MDSDIAQKILTGKFYSSYQFTNSLSVGLAVVTGFALIRIIQKIRWGSCPKKYSMNGKTVIITGSNSGIGKATALDLAKRDARVILACRNVDKAEKAAKYIRQLTSQGELVVKKLDLSSLSSIRNFAKEFQEDQSTVDVLINNAGVYGCPYALTEDGFETHFAVNHLGHFLLTNLLLNNLRRSPSPRIVIVSSGYYTRGKLDFDNFNSEENFNGPQAYRNSKLANMLFGIELHRRLKETGVKVYLVSPGMVWTNLGRHLNIPLWKKVLLAPFAALFLRSAAEGCQTVVYCAVSDQIENKSGSYFRNCKEAPLDYEIVDPLKAKQFWEISETLTKLA